MSVVACHPTLCKNIVLFLGKIKCINLFFILDQTCVFYCNPILPCSSDFVLSHAYKHPSSTGRPSEVAPSLLQAEQAQLFQLVFVGEVVQLSENVCGPPLDLLQQLHIPPVLKATGLDTVKCIHSIIKRYEWSLPIEQKYKIS